MNARRLRALRVEAALVGDGERALLCERALDGEPEAVQACQRALDEAEARACGLAAAHPLAVLALSRVEQIGAEAAEAGDAETVLVCARALGGNLDALHECARLIRGAR